MPQSIHVSVHAPDDSNVVDSIRDVREDLTDFDSALSVTPELEWGSIGGSRLSFGAKVLHREWLPVKLAQNRLRIERVDV